MLTIVVTIVIIASLINNYIVMQQHSFGLDYYVIILSIAIPASLLSLFTGEALKHKKPWAKVPALLIALLALMSPPLGTILSIFVFYYLYKGWAEFSASGNK